MNPQAQKAVAAASEAVKKQLTSWGLTDNQKLWEHLHGNAMQSIAMGAEVDSLKSDGNYPHVRRLIGDPLDVITPTPENAAKLDADYHTPSEQPKVYDYVETLLALLKRTGARAAIDSLNDKSMSLQTGFK